VASLAVIDRGPVRVAILDNPAKRNALDLPLLADIEAVCRSAGRDRVRCLLFRGAGDAAFCSGFDIGAIPTGPQEEADRPDLAVERTMEAVEAVPCPTIAFLNGSAFGGGCELAVACDLRVAREGIQIGMPPARLGVVYPVAGLRRFLSLLGPARAKELFFTGRALDGERALAIGLVDRLLPAGDAEAAAQELAEEIARNAPLAVQGMKRILRLLEAAHERAFTQEEREEIARARRQAFESRDTAEGRAAFLEKRPPLFRGE
jgi:enoyl-CoA hydratase